MISKQSNQDFVKAGLRKMKNLIDTQKTKTTPGVDKGLVAMFLKMTPEERLKANDNAVRAIMELKNAYKQRAVRRDRSKQNP